ncbi:unnamed protein product [Ascophyllum nodosum]
MASKPANSSETSHLVEEGGNGYRPFYRAAEDDTILKPFKSLTGRRLLMFSVLIMLAYLLAGIVVYTVIANMSVLDALYFSVVTLTTVGYGDLRAHKPTTKLFACLYILVGVAMIGALLAKVVEILLRQEEQVLLDFMKKQSPRHGGSGNNGETSGIGPGGVLSSGVETLSNVNPYYVKLGAGILSFVTLVLFGTVIFMFLMDMTFVDAFYLTVVSASTVGYGDFSPETTATKLFAIFYLPVSTLFLAKVVSDYTEMTIEANKRKSQRRILLSKITSREFEEMDENKDGKIDKCEFLVRQLVLQEKVTQAEIDQVWEQFERLDTNQNGFLEFEEVSVECDTNSDGVISP